MRTIDLRSDTVTKLTLKMREAMAKAEVGDDVYKDDNTVNELEALACKVLNKDAAIFVTSGTLGNLLAILSQTNKGEEIILSSNSHILTHEVGGVAYIAGCMTKAISNDNDFIYAKDVANNIRVEDIHEPKTSLLCLENALGNGMVVPLDIMKETYLKAKENNLRVHLDGARIFNAAIALNTSVSEVAKYADTVMFCLSKGLAAPIGSMLVGDKETIDKARKLRKMLGGGMRQAGVLAGPGIIAINEMSKRLKEDHDNAKYLALKLKETNKFEINDHKIDINIVFAKYLGDTNDLDSKLDDAGILYNKASNNVYRFVTHLDINKKDIDNFINVIE